MKNDRFIRFMTRNGALRGGAALVTDTLRELTARHDLWPTAAVALGRTLAGCALLSGLLKEGQRVALTVEGNGPLRKIIAEGDHDGALRGTVSNPHVDLMTPDGRFDVAGAVGRAGFLTVTRDLGIGTPYRGTVQLVTSEIGDDIAWYLTDSEQIPSAVGLAVGANREGITVAGGFIVQSLPPVDERVIEETMERIRSLPPLSPLLEGGEPPEGVIRRVLGDLSYDILEIRPLRFQCSCSRQKVTGILATLGPAELIRMAGEEEGTEVTCHFCGERYRFTPLELSELAATLGLSGGNA